MASLVPKLRGVLRLAWLGRNHVKGRADSTQHSNSTFVNTSKVVLDEANPELKEADGGKKDGGARGAELF